ncbi:MAG: sulfate permease [Gaiellaceae bacterium]
MNAPGGGRRHGVARVLPGLSWIPEWRSIARRDALAALAVWAILVPQAMAYATLAGVPPVYGLYAALAALVAYALLGTGRQLNVGPSSGVAVLSAATIAPLAAADGDRFLTLTATLAILTGVLLLLAGIARLGFLSELIAKPVLAGYFVGLGLVIAVSQLPALLGITIPQGGFFRSVWNVVRGLDAADAWTASLGVGTLALILLLRAFAPRIPGPLVAVLLGVGLSRALDLEADGVAVIGSVSSALPSVELPGVAWDDVTRLLAGAAGVALLAYAESIAGARRFAAKHGQEIDANRELVALGVANIGSGLFRGFAVDASISRTAVADDAGQRSQLAGLINAALVLTTIVALTQLFSDLPRTTLAAIVIAAVIPLTSPKELRRLSRLDQVDFGLAVLALTGVLVLGVLGGIVVAVIASLGALVYRSFRPGVAVLGQVRWEGEHDEEFGFRDLTRHPGLETFPGLVILRFDEELFFANASVFRDSIRRAVREGDPPTRAVLLDAAAITHVDTTGIDVLRDVHAELSAAGIRFMLARVKGPVRDMLERSELLEVFGAANMLPSLRSGVDSYRRQ